MRSAALVPSVCLAALLVTASYRALPAVTHDEPNDLVVHEWGTFLAMQGSDGAVLDGMYHEEHSLPEFVHSRSRDQLHIPSIQMKGETPVIYFYSTKRQRLSVSVQFPEGIWTQWYPQARTVAPGLASLGSELDPRNGRIGWAIELLPQTSESPANLPAAGDGALWNYARDVDAVTVRTSDTSSKPASNRDQASLKPARDEFERFIFYRGLGRAKLPIEFAFDQGGTLHAASDGDVDLLHLFVIRVENGRGAYRYLSRLDAGQSKSNVIPDMGESLPIDAFVAKISDDLETRLTSSNLYAKEARWKTQMPESPAGPFHWSGLYPKEARAMVNTWRTSYFQTDGIRVLFVLPQLWTDRFIPMRLSTAPQDLTRVMVGRLEVLAPEREALAEAAVRDLAAGDSDRRNQAFDYLRGQGRYVEPVVRRVLATSNDESVLSRCRNLLLSDFVTELRSAANSATDGARISEDPLFVRAKLAALLRAVGEPAAAQSEARSVLDALASVSEPALSSAEAREYLRAKARAFEGLGDDSTAAAWYGKLMRYASQVRPGNDCTNCHRANEAPRDLTWYHDWWAGKRLAQSVSRAGLLDQQIQAQEAVLARDQRDSGALLTLAFLYEAAGDAAKAKNAWSMLGALSEPQVADKTPLAETPSTTSGSAPR